MKKVCLVAVLALAVVTGSVAAEDKEPPWFDLKNCAFCKHLDAEPGLIEHMQMEWLDLPKGILMIGRVDEAYREAYERANKKMEKVGKHMMETGEIPYMCGHCRAYGELIMLAGEPQHIRGELAEVLIWTSENPETVKKMQAFAKRTMDELAAFETPAADTEEEIEE